MSDRVRAAMTETKNAFAGMPRRLSDLDRLAGRLDELRAANLAHHEQLIGEAAAIGAQIVCLGELFAAPYFALSEDPLWYALAEDATDGPSVRTMQAAARRHQVVLLAPIYELEANSGKRFNTVVVIAQDGTLLGKYRKTHVPSGANERGAFHETFYYERSDGNLGHSAVNVSQNPFFPVFETSCGRVGVATCYDRHFEGVVRTLAREGAQIVFSPAVTFGDKSRRMWALEFPVDAARHNVYIGGSNRRGREPPWNVEFFGGSFFAGPNGRVARAAEHDSLVVADLDLSELAAPDAAGWDLPRDARPDIYSLAPVEVAGARVLVARGGGVETPPAGPRSEFPIAAVRRSFPGLRREVDGRPVVLLDGPAGSQVPQPVVDAVAHCLAHTSANRGGVFATSREAGEMVDDARRAMADFVGARSAEEIVFGPCMTTLCFMLARSLARGFEAGDEVLLTRLDHDANVTPWSLAAAAAGARVQLADIRREDCTLDMDDFDKRLTPRTRLVAVVAASNLAGTTPDLATIIDHAHAAGACVVVDAVHYAPHRRIDVRAWDCDFLFCSPYKFFGPHLGVLWGRGDLLRALPVDHLRPAPSRAPESWELGTQNHEGIAGTRAAVDYLADLGSAITGEHLTRRDALTAAFEAIARYENGLSGQFLEGLRALPAFRLHGIEDTTRLDQRTPTFALTHERRRPREIAADLAARGIFAWHGNCYALPVSEALGREPDGVLRVGFLHYNTAAEVSRLLAALAEVG